MTGTGFGEKKKCVKKRAIKPEKEVFRGELLLVGVIRDGTRNRLLQCNQGFKPGENADPNFGSQNEIFLDLKFESQSLSASRIWE